MIADFLINMLLAMILISLFRVMRQLFRLRKVIKQCKDNPNVESIMMVNGQIKVIEKKASMQPAQVVDQVTDEICHRTLEKDKAYRVVKDGVEHYFCSWECREKFLKQEEGNK